MEPSDEAPEDCGGSSGDPLAHREAPESIPAAGASSGRRVRLTGRTVVLCVCVALVAAIAATVLTMRRRANLKRTVPSEQVQVRRADRIRLVNIESGERQ